MSKIVLFPVVQRLAQWSPVAVLIPEDISATAVPHGERKFHSFLKILFEARPDVSGESSGNHPEGHCLQPGHVPDCDWIIGVMRKSYCPACGHQAPELVPVPRGNILCDRPNDSHAIANRTTMMASDNDHFFQVSFVFVSRMNDSTLRIVRPLPLG